MQNDSNKIKAIFDLSIELAKKGEFENAVKEISKIIEQIKDTYQDTDTTEYRNYDSQIEVLLYSLLYDSNKKVISFSIPYAEIYRVAGYLFYNIGELDKAEEMLLKSLHYNPVSTINLFEYAELCKAKKEMTKYFECIKKILMVCCDNKSLARAYRGLGYYFIEKNNFNDAAISYVISSFFEKSESAEKELNLIATITKKDTIEVSQSDVSNFVSKYEINYGASEAVLSIISSLANYCKEENKIEDSRKYYTMLYELVRDEKIKDIINSLN